MSQVEPTTRDLDPEQVQRVDIPTGNAGTDATVEVMAQAAMGQYGAGSARIRNLAVQIVRGEMGGAPVPERDQPGEVGAIHEWMQEHLRYVRDPLWYEFVTYPETLAFTRADGDCDDHCVLEAALLGSIGIPTRFVVYAFNKQSNFSHVALQAYIRFPDGTSSWETLDPIVKDQPAGWSVPDATTTKVYGVNGPNGTLSKAPNVTGMLGALASVAGVIMAFRRAMRLLD